MLSDVIQSFTPKPFNYFKDKYMYKNKNYPISIVILAHNEVEIIEKVILDFYNKIVKNINSELIIAEDGSTDGIKEVLKPL